MLRPEINSSRKINPTLNMTGSSASKSRLSDVTKQLLTKLKNPNHPILGKFSVMVNERIHCADCDTQLSVTQLLKQGIESNV